MGYFNPSFVKALKLKVKEELHILLLYFKD